jgi:hypothetical protein
MYVDLAPHQLAAMKKMKNGCILWGGVGTGKTRVALAYYLNCETPEDLYVITTAKKRDSLDWEAEAAKTAIGKTKEASLAGVLHVDSWNNIAKYEDVEGAFFIFDEQRLVGSGAWVKSFYKIAKKNKWILLSATPGDTWLDYIPVFVANGFFKNKTQFLREHVVYNTFTKFPKVDRYTGVGKLVRLRNSILVEMPFKRHTVREEIDVKVKYDTELFHKAVTARWNVFEHRPVRNIAELFLVMRKIVNSDASRLDAVRSIMKEHPRLIVFYTFDYELDLLRTLGDEPCPTTNLTQTKSDFSEKSVHSIKKERTISASEKRVLSLSDLPSPQTQTSIGRNSKGDGSTPSKKVSVAEQNDQSQLDQEKFESTENFLTSVPMKNSKLIEDSSNRWEERNSNSIKTSGIPSTRNTKEVGSTTVNINREPSSSAKEQTSVSIAEWNGHKHEPVPETERWVYLVQYAAGSESWNCITTDAMVFYSLTYSYKMWEQAHGRIDRMNTPFTELWYYVLMSNSFIDKAIKKALDSKQNFQEAKYSHIKMS